MPNVIYNGIPIKWYRGDEHWSKEKQVKTSILGTNRHLDITKEEILNGEYFIKVVNKNFDTNEPLIIPKWEIESVERYYWLSGRYSKTYREVTFWIDKVNCQRKETTREVHISDGEEYRLPVWAQSCVYKRSMNYDR